MEPPPAIIPWRPVIAGNSAVHFLHPWERWSRFYVEEISLVNFIHAPQCSRKSSRSLAAASEETVWATSPSPRRVPSIHFGVLPSAFCVSLPDPVKQVPRSDAHVMNRGIRHDSGKQKSAHSLGKRERPDVAML